MGARALLPAGVRRGGVFDEAFPEIGCPEKIHRAIPVAVCQTGWQFDSMTAQESILADLNELPDAQLQEAAEYVHQLRLRAAAGRQAAFDATFGSMTASEADAFERAIENGCERIDP